MNKTKMTLAVIGGVIALAVLVMAYFTWEAFSARTAAAEGDEEEGTDGLETVVSKAQTLSRKPVYPCAASLTAIESNRVLVAEWQAEAAKLASRGDRVYEKTTPAAFKTFIVADAKRLVALPGAVGGVLAKPEFAFGPFKDYIAEGKMPADAQLAELQRQWDDVATITETLAKSGIAELVDVQLKAAEAKADETQTRTKPAKRPAKSADAAKPTLSANSVSYVFTFSAKPAAFVKAMNALTVNERFISVDGFTFSRPKDAIAEALGGEEKKEQQQAGGRRGRRGRRGAPVEEQAAEAAKEAAAKNGIVTDPLLDEPLTVVMNVTVHDFRSLEDKQEGASK